MTILLTTFYWEKGSGPDGSTNEFYNCTCGTKRPVKIDSTGYSKFFFEEHKGIEHILQEYDQLDVLKAEYTLGSGIDKIISKTISKETIYYHYNSLGSVAMLTDETGNLIGKYEYEPYGQILSYPEEIDNRFTFTGREYDKDSGLYFYRARYYDASVGRFMTRDPQLKTISTSPPSGCGVGRGGLDIYNPSDLHSYVYVRNNPVNLKDPTGQLSKCAKDALKFFGSCVVGLNLVLDIPLSIAVGGCVFLPPPAVLPCLKAVFVVFARTEFLEIMTCVTASISEYNKCKEKECKEK